MRRTLTWSLGLIIIGVIFASMMLRHPTYSQIYELGGMKRLSGYAPIYQDHDPTKEIVAISVIDFNAKIVTERTLSHKKTKPISTLIEQTTRIANGNIAAREIHIASKDEVGDLARSLVKCPPICER